MSNITIHILASELNQSDKTVEQFIGLTVESGSSGYPWVMLVKNRGEQICVSQHIERLGCLVELDVMTIDQFLDMQLHLRPKCCNLLIDDYLFYTDEEKKQLYLLYVEGYFSEIIIRTASDRVYSIEHLNKIFEVKTKIMLQETLTSDNDILWYGITNEEIETYRQDPLFYSFLTEPNATIIHKLAMNCERKQQYAKHPDKKHSTLILNKWYN